MALPRFERERFTIMGRPGESKNPAWVALANEHFTVVCIRAEPRKGFASHSHDTEEAFDVIRFSVRQSPENSGLVAAGMHIIASLDGEGAHTVEESGTGLACPAEDADALSQAILRYTAHQRKH